MATAAGTGPRRSRHAGVGDTVAVDDAERLVGPIVGELDRHRAAHRVPEDDGWAGVEVLQHQGDVVGERP